MNCRHGWVGAWLAALLACAVVGYLALFSSFRPYDDEGLFMLSNRLFLDGHQPYTELSWLFGPVHLAWVQFVHGVLGVPITHEAVRFLTLLQWLAVALASGALVRSLTGSAAWGCAALLLSFVYLQSIVNEPGHPQALIALATLMVPLCVGQRERGWQWLLVGALAAVIALVKANAGLFILAAVSVALASQAQRGRGRRMLMAGAVAGSLVFPFVLMLPFLVEPDCRRFALIAALSTTAVALAAFGTGGGHPAPQWRAPYYALAGLVITALLAMAYAALLGIQPRAILAALLGYAEAQARFYHLFRPYTVWQPGLAAVSLALAALASFSTPHRVKQLAARAATLAFVIAAGYSVIIDSPAHAQSMLGWALPWSWALLVSGTGDRATSARVLLAFIAAWSPLLAYPIPGSQLYFGCLPVLLAAVVCAADLTRDLTRSVSARVPTLRLASVLPGVALALSALLVVEQYITASTRYRASEALALAGTGPLRVEPALAERYRQLVAAADRYDTAFTTFRFNSLVFWSRAGFPGPDALSQFPLDLASPAEQASTLASLSRAGRVLLIDRVDLRKARTPGTVSELIDDHFQPAGRVGPYLLLAKKAGSATQQ